MNVIVNGLVLACALCPALAHTGVPGGLLIAVVGMQDAEKTNDAPDVDPRAVAELQKMITELERYDRVIVKTRTTWEAIQDSGMKLQFDAEQEIGIHRPNKLYSIVLRDDGRRTKFFFDRNSSATCNESGGQGWELARGQVGS